MSFDMTGAQPRVQVHTYSSLCKKESAEVTEYSDRYKAQEKPQMSDADFHAQDDFTIDLSDFRSRFANGSTGWRAVRRIDLRT